MKLTSWTTLIGIMAGLIGPWIVMYIYYYLNFRANSFEVFLDRLLYSTLFGPVLSLCVMVNLLLFFVFLWTRKDQGSMGVLLSTIIYAFVVFGFKFFAS